MFHPNEHNLLYNPDHLGAAPLFTPSGVAPGPLAADPWTLFPNGNASPPNGAAKSYAFVFYLFHVVSPIPRSEKSGNAPPPYRDICINLVYAWLLLSCVSPTE